MKWLPGPPETFTSLLTFFKLLHLSVAVANLSMVIFIKLLIYTTNMNNIYVEVAIGTWHVMFPGLMSLADSVHDM